MIYAHIESPDISAVCKSLDRIPGTAHSVLLTSLAHTLPKVRNKLAELTAARFTLNASRAKKFITGATLSQGISIRVRGKRLPMSYYRVIPAKPQKRPKGLITEVRRGHLEKYPRGFVANFNGNQPAMIRVSPGHNKGLRDLYGPAVPELAGGVVLQQLTEYARSEFTKIFMKNAQVISSPNRYHYQYLYVGTRSFPI